MSNQEIADSGVLRNSLTSLSPFPFKACSERIIDFHFLALKKMQPPFYFTNMLGRVLRVWDWEIVKQPDKLPNFQTSKQITHQIEFSLFEVGQRVKFGFILQEVEKDYLKS